MPPDVFGPEPPTLWEKLRFIAESLGPPLVMLGLAVVLLRWLLARFRASANDGYRQRLTVTRLMAVVALIGLGLGLARWFRQNFATVYAPGYREDRFARVRIGMTREEVQLLLGPPMRKAPKPGEDWSYNQHWIYSSPPGPGLIGDNYWRRWVIFNPADGKVVAIINDYYID